MRRFGIAIGCVVASASIAGQSVSYRPLDISSQDRSQVVSADNRLPAENNLSVSAPRHTRMGVESDWTQRHTLYPVSKNLSVLTRIQKDPRWTQEWYLRHREVWWPGAGQRQHNRSLAKIKRDWSEPLGFTGSYSSIASISQTGTTVTVTTTAANALAPGQGVVIAGVSAGTGGCSSSAAAAIDGEQTITGTGYEAFTFTSSQSATIGASDCTLANPTTAVGPTSFQPLYDFAFALGSFYPNPPGIQSQAGFGTLNTQDLLNGTYLATAGMLTATASATPPGDTGTYPLLPGGPGYQSIFGGATAYDNTLFPDYPAQTPYFTAAGLMFTDTTRYISLFYNPTDSVYDDWIYFAPSGPEYQFLGGPVTLNNDPDGGQTSPAKYVFDVTAAPSCSGDFVAMGIPANAVAGSQANIVGYNNLYTGSSPTGICSGTAPTVMFAYASGAGEVPGSISISPDGTQLAYVEDLLSGSSVFHLLTIGTSGTNGASPTAPVVPGIAGGNNAVDTTVALSGGSGSCAAQSSTTSPFIRYTTNDAYPDAAYVTTYSWSATVPGTGTGCLYKIGPVFSGGTPTIAWSVPISAVPSSPVYDTTSNKVFFTDSSGNIDYVTDTGTPSTYSSVAVAAGTTSENPPTVDSINEMVYATFNTNGTNAVVVQAPIGNLASFVTVPVGTGNTTYTGPYGVDFNNAWYTGGPGSAGALMYVAGTGSGTVPTLYSVGFGAGGVMNTSVNSSARLTSITDPVTGNPTVGDASYVTEFFNANDTTGGPDGTDYLFVGVTDSCAATEGGNAGCVMSLNITSGAPTNTSIPSATAIAAPGGSTGIIVDNDANTTAYPQASSAYYGTKNGGTLVKATQNGLN